METEGMENELERVNPQQTEITLLKSETEALIRASISSNILRAYRHGLERSQTYLSDRNLTFSGNALASFTYLHGQGRAIGK